MMENDDRFYSGAVFLFVGADDGFWFCIVLSKVIFVVFFVLGTYFTLLLDFLLFIINLVVVVVRKK